MRVPRKPFSTYKWRWFSATPSEGLLKAPVYLGVIRALSKFEGDRFSSGRLKQELARVERDTESTNDLPRTVDRNLIRNSGQYWKGTGLLTGKRGKIELTELGRRVANGSITNDEFAALMVRNTVLPNPATYKPEELEKWQQADLRIKPLEYILSVMGSLGRDYGIRHAYLSPNELIKIVIPLAGEKSLPQDTSEPVYMYRTGRLDTSGWPNYVPENNDKRLAREFLLFLRNFGICQTDSTSRPYDEKFRLDQVMTEELRVDAAPTFLEDIERIEQEIEESRNSEITTIIERARVMASVIKRPNQAKFRKEVLNASQHSCIFTNEKTLDVLEAAHIVPVKLGGTDLVGNGLCMRADIHRLFDNGKIRIHPNGDVMLNEYIHEAISYSELPQTILFPSSISPENLEWRSRYL